MRVDPRVQAALKRRLDEHHRTSLAHFGRSRAAMLDALRAWLSLCPEPGNVEDEVEATVSAMRQLSVLARQR